MNCLKCGNYISSYQKFCGVCGEIIILCPSCNNLVSQNDLYCGKCGFNLSEIIAYAKMTQKEKEKLEISLKEQLVEQQRERELKAEMKAFASDLIIDCEGNKFKAVKTFKEKYCVENDVALEYITEAYNKINFQNSNKIEYQTLEAQMPNVANAPITETQPPKIANNPLMASETINNNYSRHSNYEGKRGIRKTIIVSQSSRKKATSAVSRGLIGGAILGPVGLLAGASAKSKEMTTFQVIYNNGKQETVQVKNDSYMFKEYCKYLDN